MATADIRHQTSRGQPSTAMWTTSSVVSSISPEIFLTIFKLIYIHVIWQMPLSELTTVISFFVQFSNWVLGAFLNSLAVVAWWLRHRYPYSEFVLCKPPYHPPCNPYYIIHKIFLINFFYIISTTLKTSIIITDLLMIGWKWTRPPCLMFYNILFFFPSEVWIYK